MPSAGIGPGGPQAVEATLYDWKWYYSAPGCVIWLALILALALPKSNRNLGAFLILLPLVIVSLAWLTLRKITGMTSSSAVQFDTLVQSMAVGIAVLWLTAGYFARFRGFIRFLLSFGTIVIVTGLGVLSYSTEFSHETLLFLALFVFLALAVLAATVLARAACKGKYSPVRFMLWLALWTVLGSMVVVFALTFIANFIMTSGSSWSDIPRALLTSVIAGTALGLGLYVLNLPFMILGFVNPFCRERFCNCLRLELTAAATMPPDATIGQPRKETPAHD